jgi:hypothetical protein
MVEGEGALSGDLDYFADPCSTNVQCLMVCALGTSRVGISGLSNT